MTNCFNQYDDNALTNAKISEATISEVTDQLKENSASGLDRIVAIFLEKTQIIIAKSMMLLMRQSQDENSKADNHKMAYTSPIQKEGSKNLMS